MDYKDKVKSGLHWFRAMFSEAWFSLSTRLQDLMMSSASFSIETSKEPNMWQHWRWTNINSVQNLANARVRILYAIVVEVIFFVEYITEKGSTRNNNHSLT